MAEHDDVPTVRGDESAPGGDDTGDDGSAGGLESRVLLARARSRLLGRTPEPVRVGRYRILHRLGQGGMGVVYLAHDDELDRRVAIKILRHDLAPSSEGRSRLLREAQATARLSHPNVVHVYEVGHEADQVYMAMEYIEGDTLRRWFAAKPRAWNEIVAMHLACGEALAAAHAVGLVHRDFKPDNVLVGRDGRPRVVDFGLARIDEATITRESASASTRAALDVTATATLAGTPAYMAPEQHARQPADPRSDQFAFCVTLFEALYGKRPFAGDTLTELAVRIAEGEQADVDPVARGVPVDLHAVVVRGLARHPRQRFADMRELLDALRRSAAPPVRRAWWPLAAIGAGALGVVALAQTWGPRAPTPITDEAPIADVDEPVSPWAPILDASDLPAPVPAPLEGDATGVTVHRLANGLTVYVAHRPAEPTITAHVAVRAGVEDVPPEDQGMAALVLDVMLQGSDRVGTTSWEIERPFVTIEHALLRSLELTHDPAARKDIERLVEAAQLGARPLRIPYEPVTVGNELGFRRQTVLGGTGATFSVEVPAHRLGAWVELVAEMMQRPSFRAFASVTAQRLELIRWVNQDTLGDRAAVHAFAPTVGRKYDPVVAADVMRRLPLARARAFHREYFRPNNTAIVLVGDITPAEALPLVLAHFGAWEPAAIPEAGFVPAALPAKRTVKTLETGGWSMIELAWAVPPGTADARAVEALGHALGGREGLVAEALGLRDPSDVMVFTGPLVLRVTVATRPDDSHAEIERKILEMLREVADDRIDDVVWTRALARAGLESQRWARSRRNLALQVETSFLYRQAWATTAERLSHTPTRADVVAGAKAVLERPMVVVDQRPGEPFMIDVEPIAVSPMQLVLDERSAWGRRLLDEPSTPSEPRFLVAGSHFEATPHGAGRVITTRYDGPLFHLDWILPIGARADPWACDAVRAKVRAVPVAGVDVDAVCTNDDSRITILGPSARFEAVWPDLLGWLAAPAIPAKDLDAHIVDALRWRADERTHALWGSESMHLWALRGEHGIDAHLPADKTLQRRGAVEIAASMQRLATLAPDILYTGPAPELVRAVLPPPSERGGPAREPFRFREQSEPTIVLLHEPGRPQAEVRVLVPQIRPEGKLRERLDDAQAELAAQMYEFMGDGSVDADDSLVRLELQVWVPPEGGGPILHGVGFRCAPDRLDTAIDTAIAYVQRPAEREGFLTAQARVEADFRAVRVPPHMIPEHVHRWWRSTDERPLQDPRIAQWLSLPGLSYETFAAYVAEVARTTPYVSIVADVDAIDMAALRRHGRVIQPDLDDILRDSRQSELDVLGVGLVSTNPD